MSSGGKKSGAPCGPYSTPISHSFEYCGTSSGGAFRVQQNCGPSSEIPTTSPARSTRPACPPKPPRIKVLRLSKYSGTSTPPEIARYARLPAPCEVVISSVEPAETWIDLHSGTRVP